MSCQPCRGTRFLWVLLCILTLSLPVKAAQINADEVYCFTQTDFSAQESILTGVCITALPDSARGTVRLGSRVIRAGDVLTSGQLDQMVFSPVRSDSDATAEVSYLPIYTTGLAPEATMVISIHGKEDKAPAALDSSLETYKNLPNEGKVNAQDPEGEALAYTLVRNPRRGSVELRQDGTFTYTPKKNKVGVDSFTFKVADPAGNVSREATVTVQILKPTDSKQYTDTVGMDCRFAAEWMKNTGLFVGEKIGKQECFYPEKTVSRGEFLMMLSDLLDIPTDTQTSAIPEDTPNWLKPYLAAASRAGVIAGLPEGSFTQTLTGAEMAVMLQNVLDLSLSQQTLETLSSEEETDVPAWAEVAVTVLEDNGITVSSNAGVTRGELAQVLYKVNALAPTSAGVAVLRMQ